MWSLPFPKACSWERSALTSCQPDGQRMCLQRTQHCGFQCPDSHKINNPPIIPLEHKAILAKFGTPTSCSIPPIPHHLSHKKVRLLLPESSKEVIGRENWMKLEKLGIIAKVGPGEPVDWSSALHLALKAGYDLWACRDFHSHNSIMRQEKLAVASQFSGRFSV